MDGQCLYLQGLSDQVVIRYQSAIGTSEAGKSQPRRRRKAMDVFRHVFDQGHTFPRSCRRNAPPALVRRRVTE